MPTQVAGGSSGFAALGHDEPNRHEDDGTADDDRPGDRLTQPQPPERHGHYWVHIGVSRHQGIGACARSQT